MFFFPSEIQIIFIKNKEKRRKWITGISDDEFFFCIEFNPWSNSSTNPKTQTVQELWIVMTDESSVFYFKLVKTLGCFLFLCCHGFVHYFKLSVIKISSVLVCRWDSQRFCDVCFCECIYQSKAPCTIFAWESHVWVFVVRIVMSD